MTEIRATLRGYSRPTLRLVLLISVIIVFLLTPLAIYWTLDRDGTLSVTVRSDRDEAIPYRALLDDVLMDEETLAARGNASYVWRQDWWMAECVQRTVRIEFTDAAGPSNRTSLATICDGGTVEVSIAI